MSQSLHWILCKVYTKFSCKHKCTQIRIIFFLGNQENSSSKLTYIMGQDHLKCYLNEIRFNFNVNQACFSTQKDAKGNPQISWGVSETLHNVPHISFVSMGNINLKNHFHVNINLGAKKY